MSWNLAGHQSSRCWNLGPTTRSIGVSGRLKQHSRWCSLWCYGCCIDFPVFSTGHRGKERWNHRFDWWPCRDFQPWRSGTRVSLQCLCVSWQSLEFLLDAMWGKTMWSYDAKWIQMRQIDLHQIGNGGLSFVFCQVSCYTTWKVDGATPPPCIGLSQPRILKPPFWGVAPPSTFQMGYIPRSQILVETLTASKVPWGDSLGTCAPHQPRDRCFWFGFVETLEKVNKVCHHHILWTPQKRLQIK